MNAPALEREIQIRPCSSPAEFEACVRIQKIIWGDELAVPATMMMAVRDAGGQVLGAFGEEKLLGFTLAFLGLRRWPVRSGSAQRVKTPFLHSHITAVLPDFRDRGVGRRLKLFQRQDALKRGVDLVEWTFDPLELKNAHFNLVRLGAIVRRFIPDCYGITASPLHSGLPTDRLMAEWWIASERVKSILADNPLPSKDRMVRISVPADISKRKSSNRDVGLRIQSEVRAQFQKWLSQGFAATGIETRGAAADYILEPSGTLAGLPLPAFFASEGTGGTE